VQGFTGYRFKNLALGMEKSEFLVYFACPTPFNRKGFVEYEPILDFFSKP